MLQLLFQIIFPYMEDSVILYSIKIVTNICLAKDSQKRLPSHLVSPDSEKDILQENVPTIRLPHKSKNMSLRD